MDLLSQMATFVRIVEGKSLSAAARAQRVSLAAISRQLTSLEAELGASLIVRSTRRLHVTDAGRQWYASCVRILRDVDEARGAIGDDREPRGTVVVSASLTFGSVVVVPRLAALAERHPKLTVELRLEDQLIDLVAEGVDVALRAGSPPPDSTAYVAQPIFAMRRIVVASPRWLRKHGAPRTPAQLAERPCLQQVTPAGALVRWLGGRVDDTAPPSGSAADRGHAAAGEAPDAALEHIAIAGRLRCNAPVALRELAVDGAGAAFLPEWLVVDELASGRLRRVLPAWASPPIMSWAIYRSELRGAPRLRAVLAALPRDAAELTASRARRT